MSYESLEGSAASGQPIELYDFNATNLNQHWRYTSAAEEQTLLTYTYTPDTINRKELEITSNHFKNKMEVTLGRGNLFALQFIAGPIESEVTLTIYRLQGAEYIFYWVGVVNIVKFDADAVPTVLATPKSATLSRVSKRRKGQKLCDHALYDSGCGVNKESYKITGSITTVSGKTIISSTFSSKANNWLTGGMIVVGYAKRLISSHTGNTITISRPFLNTVVAGHSFTAYAGCNHWTDCESKFANKLNYGGQDRLVLKSPFGREAIG